MTFSISARCPETGMFGIAISSSSPAVAARCAHARAGVGVVATQNITDPRLGPSGLDLMERGASAEEALETLVSDNPWIEYRQLALVDARGGTANHSGAHTLGVHAIAKSESVVAAGNLLANPEVPQTMVAAFQKLSGHLAERLLAAMKAGLVAGGEAGPVHSAGLLLVRDVPWPIADLRVDWHEDDPIGTLEDLWLRYQPDLESYVTRALDPSAAPSYGVLGDE